MCAQEWVHTDLQSRDSSPDRSICPHDQPLMLFQLPFKFISHSEDMSRVITTNKVVIMKPVSQCKRDDHLPSAFYMLSVLKASSMHWAYSQRRVPWRALL